MSQSTSSSPAPEPIHTHSPGIEVGEDEDGSNGDIDMIFDPVEAPFVDNESDGRLGHDSAAGSSRGTSPRHSDDGARDGAVPPVINRSYHPNINGELFIVIFVGVYYVY